MKPLSICILVLLPLATLSAQDTPYLVPGDPVEGTFQAFQEDSTLFDFAQLVLKVEYDFDSDGMVDIAVSTYPNLCGNAGCDYEIFLKRPEGYLSVGEMFFHHGAIYVERVKSGVSRIVTYRHMSAFEGTLEEYELDSTGIKEVSTVPSDTSNWAKLEQMSKGHLNSVVAYVDDIRQYLKTHQHAWRRW